MTNTENKNILDRITQYMYYFIIGIISLISLCFLPMIGTGVGLAWNTPNTVAGWVVWIATKSVVAALNVLIFHCFMQQAKLNVKDNDKYKEAVTILSIYEIGDKDYVPKDPKTWSKKQYKSKGVSIFCTTALSTIALTQAMLTFDWISMLTYLFTIVMGLIFGVMQMKTAENYWTEEFWKYAQKVKKDLELAEKECHQQEDDIASDNRGTCVLESSDSMCCISDYSEPVVVGCSWDSLCFLGRSTASDTNSDSSNAICEENI